MEDNCSHCIACYSLHHIYFVLLLAINAPSNDAYYLAYKLFSGGYITIYTFAYREDYKKSLSKENEIKVTLNEKLN